ncbi:MAG: putative DNA modification/repair radical SAM protein [Anaerovoracaceae bacterium]
MNINEKLKILAEGAKYDVSCSSSGADRGGTGKMGSAYAPGICHSWSADGRCISLLKVLYSNDCAYDCEFCVNRRSADVKRATFEPYELADLTIEFYKRNYIEGLFVSSAVNVSPDYSSERILKSLFILRKEYGFAGYIHAKIIPGTSPELVHAIGLEADRLSVNAELPTKESLETLTPQKKLPEILEPMKQITNTLIERDALKGPGIMFKGQELNTTEHYLTGDVEKNYAIPKNSSKVSEDSIKYMVEDTEGIRNRDIVKSNKKIQVSMNYVVKNLSGKKDFASAGQTTQFIVGASGETDKQILDVSEKMYHTFKMQRVYFSAYIPLLSSPALPDINSVPQLGREHRLYQADWLLRFYGFEANEILDDKNPNLDVDLDPKISWALRNLQIFPIEVNKASLDEILRIPGIGTLSALRIIRQRRVGSVGYDDLKKMGVVLKRAKHFLTCNGKYYGIKDYMPSRIKMDLLGQSNGVQLSLFDNGISTGHKKVALNNNTNSNLLLGENINANTAVR